MALNPYFSKFSFKPTQDMYLDIVTEAVSIYGHAVYYIPRNLTNFDQLYETDDQSTFTTIIPTEIYIENIQGFSGDQNIFTKIAGLEIYDSISASIVSRTFDREIYPVTRKSRPGEGDLIYFTLNKKCFQIKFVNNKEIFYPLGILPTYQMTLELFQYSDETFNTGIPEIDSIQQNLSLNIFDNAITNENTGLISTSNGDILVIGKFQDNNIDPTSDNLFLNNTEGSFINTNSNNIWGDITYL